MADERHFCTFFLENYFFGVDVQQVQEVFRYQEQTRVPLAPKVVSGLINLRGQIVTAIDLRRRLGLSERAAGQQPMNVVVRTADGPVCLLVDEIGDVVEVTGEAFDPVLETLVGIAHGLIGGVYKLIDSLLLVLDIEKTVDLSHSYSPTHENGQAGHPGA